MSMASSVATRVLALPISTNMDLVPLPPPPPPAPSPSGDESDDESDDDDHDDEPTQSKPPQPPTPNTGAASSSSLSSSSSILPKSTNSIISTTLAASLSSSSTATETSQARKITLTTSATSQTSESSTSSSVPQSDDNESTSIQTSSTLSTPSTSTSTFSHSSAATALPIGQPDSGLETKAGSSPLSTAGIILAAVFGFIALITTIYLLYRLRRRRQEQSSSSTDHEKQRTGASNAQETGVIFGRRSDSRSSPSSFTQHDEQPRGRGRSRFSFLNRRWYSTGTQFSNSQQQQQQQQQQTQNPQPHLHTITTATHNTEPSPSPLRWPSPFFFTLGQGPNPRSSSRTHNQYYPPIPPTPQTVTTITRLTTDIHRNISTRTTDSDQSGSGHARAYAHHGIRAPHSLVINAARNTISSISSRLIWTRQRNSRVSDVTSRTRDADTDTENICSPVSEISDPYHGHGDHSPQFFPPQKHRLSDSHSHLSDTPARTQNVMPSRWSSSESDLESATTPNVATNTNRLDSHDPRISRARFTDMPRLPLPAAVSRGSWGSKIEV